MGETVSVRDLRNRGGDVIDRVVRDGPVTITRDGVAVAELRSLPRPGLTARELIRRRQSAAHVDPAEMRADIDALIDPTL